MTLHDVNSGVLSWRGSDANDVENSLNARKIKLDKVKHKLIMTRFAMLIKRLMRLFPGLVIHLLDAVILLQPEGHIYIYIYIYDLMQDCSITSALLMEIHQSCTKPRLSYVHSSRHDIFHANIFDPLVEHLYVCIYILRISRYTCIYRKTYPRVYMGIFSLGDTRAGHAQEKAFQ